MYQGNLRLVVDEGRGARALRLVGSQKRLTRPQRFFLQQYFNRWGNFIDLREYEKFKRELQFAGIMIETAQGVEEYVEAELQRRVALFDARLASGVEFQVVVKPKADRLSRSPYRIVTGIAGKDMSLPDPLDAFGLEERLKEAGCQVEYTQKFRELFPRYMRNRVSLEESQRFHRQLAVRYLPEALEDDIRGVVEEFTDASRLLTEPARADEFVQQVQTAGAKLRLTSGARSLAQFYRQKEGLGVRRNGQGPADLAADLKRGSLRLPLKKKLYRFQELGVAHLFLTGRALLADDMGLGKTVQSIAAALALRRYKGIKRALVICPASLKLQWRQEIERHAGEEALVITGDADERAGIYSQVASEQPPLFTVVNYELTFRDIDLLEKIPFDLLIIDEVQRIKNFRTKTYAAIKKIKHDYIFALSGTPLETELEELYNIVRLVNPEVLPANPLKFRHRYCKFDRFGKIVGYQHIPEVTRRIAAITLRRTRADALGELPRVQERPVWLEFEAKQRAIYDGIRDGLNRALSAEQLRELDASNVMTEVMRLREICDSPRIHFPEMKPSPKEMETLALLEEHIHGRRKQAVVFTQWTRMGNLLEEELREAGFAVAYLHGGVEARKRAELVEEFQRGKYHVFLSTDAGGLGLNLQSASMVINFDLPFNPAKVEQRVARAHRLGQTESVYVVNLLMSGSIEENLVRIIARRQRLFSDVFAHWESGEKPEQITVDEWLRDVRKLARELLRTSEG